MYSFNQERSQSVKSLNTIVIFTEIHNIFVFSLSYSHVLCFLYWLKLCHKIEKDTLSQAPATHYDKSLISIFQFIIMPKMFSEFLFFFRLFLWLQIILIVLT